MESRLSGQSSIFRTNNSKLAAGIGRVDVDCFWVFPITNGINTAWQTSKPSTAATFLARSRGGKTLLTDAEAGQRGFLLTGKNQDLEPYDRATQELPSEPLFGGARLTRSCRKLT